MALISATFVGQEPLSIGGSGTYVPGFFANSFDPQSAQAVVVTAVYPYSTTIIADFIGTEPQSTQGFGSAVIPGTFADSGEPAKTQAIDVTILPFYPTITTTFTGQEPRSTEGFGSYIPSTNTFVGSEFINLGSFDPVILPQTSNAPVETRYFLG
jgi:hypothetical protein